MQRFDGPTAHLIAKAMARGNRDAEAEAIAELDPPSTATILAIGFGPGVGLELLSPVVARVIGVDPSAVMVREAARRTRDLANVTLHRATADELPLDDATVDGAIAVNSMQLWDPFDASVAEVARVLRPGGRLVTLTHDWAMAHHEGSVDAWLDRAQRVCEQHGLDGCRSWRGTSERGKELLCRQPSKLNAGSGQPSRVQGTAPTQPSCRLSSRAMRRSARLSAASRPVSRARLSMGRQPCGSGGRSGGPRG